MRRLKPALHLYGHTHIPLDLSVAGVRYVQWPLGYSREAEMQCAPVRRHKALCVYDSNLVRFPSSTSTQQEQQQAGEDSTAGAGAGVGCDGIPKALASEDCAWSQYYRAQARDARVVAPLAPWVTQRLESFSGLVYSAGKQAAASEGGNT